MLNYEYPPLGGGAANANRYLLKEFANEDDLMIDLVTASPDGYREESSGENVRIYRLDVSKDAIHYWTQPEILRYSWRAFRKSRELMNDVDFDLVHAWFGVPSGVIAWTLGLPYIVALRGSDVPGYNDRFTWQYIFLKPFVRRVWRDAEAVIANSAGLRNLARQTADVSIDVIPNGVAIEEFEHVYHERDRLQVLCVSRLIERKGVRDLIDAVAQLDVDLTIVGTGDREETLKERVADLDIGHHVTFTGFIPHEDIHRYYEHADVFVLPSRNEGMSNTVLEAMAAGLPVLITNTGGAAELLNDNGELIDYGDPKSIKEGLRRYIDRPWLIREDGTRSREVVSNYQWDRVAAEYARAYSHIG